MTSSPLKNAWMSEVDPGFAPLIPAVNEAFKHILTYMVITEFRGNWTRFRACYADYKPSEGFETSHRTILASDGTETEIRVYRPQLSANQVLPLLFVLHGGGWVVGGHDSENAMNRAICVRNKVAVLSVDYRRAPEHKYPTALNDSYEAYHWILRNASELCIDRERILLGGTSSGANLIAGLVLKLRDENGLHGIIGQMLNIPALCHPHFFPNERYELASYEQNADAPTINGRNMRWFWDQYYPNAEPDPFASPLLAGSLSGIPPTLIQVAGLDPLRDEGIAYAEALEKSGVSTKLKLYPGLPHGFVLAIKLDIVTKYYSSMVEWVACRLKAHDPSPGDTKSDA